MRTYSCAYLSYHGERFIALRLAPHGVTFAQYLADPDRYDHLALEFEPLLPAQRAVQARLDAEVEPTPVEAEVAHLPQRNGAVVETLHHNRYPRTTACDFKRRKAQ